MDNKIIECSFKGLLRAFLITAGAIIIYSIFNYFIPSTECIKGKFLLILSLLSILYGAYYAAKKAQKKGWAIGLIVSVMYMLIVYLLSIAAGNSFSFNKTDFLRILLALVVGILSGMLGINV